MGGGEGVEIHFKDMLKLPNLQRDKGGRLPLSEPLRQEAATVPALGEAHPATKYTQDKLELSAVRFST